MSRSWLYAKFALILLLAIAGGFVVFDKLDLVKINKSVPFRLGLDLSGGTHLLYEGNLADIKPEDRADAMNSVRVVIERRVNAFGVAEPVVQVSGDNRLIVELPGVKDIDAALKQIGQTPFLEFREENPDYQLPDDPQLIDFLARYRPTGLSGKHLQKAEIVYDQASGDPTPKISLHFNDEGSNLFAEITQRNLGKTVAIFLDGTPISAPIVNDAITTGQAVIRGNFDINSAKDLVQRLNSGALPVPIKLLQQQNIGPSLGQESLKKSIVAGLVGFAAIMLFMISYYRFPGLIAVLALVIYVILSLAIFKLFGVTLTLAGIAGFILSVGMAVDANVLVFERTREEARSGQDALASREEGFRRAWNAIRDSNVSSLITAVILWWFGTSLIRGFALTLGIGILISMFTSLTVSRTFLRLMQLKKNV